jgi:hypothetical protein
MDTYCHSCGMPLTGDVKGNFCSYCCNEKGELKSREEVHQGIAMWLKQIKPGEKGVNYQERARYYMKAMPAWAD